LTKELNEEFGNPMWVLKGNNIKQCNLTIIDASIAWLQANKTNEKIGRLMWVLQGENNIKYNMKYSYVGIPYSNKCYVYC
jgi:hypothetical protein